MKPCRKCGSPARFEEDIGNFDSWRHIRAACESGACRAATDEKIISVHDNLKDQREAVFMATIGLIEEWNKSQKDPA